MGLTEILLILIFVGVAAAVALLLVLLLRAGKGGGGMDDAACGRIADRVSREMRDTLRREVTEPILRTEREGQAAQRTELSESVAGLGRSLRESQRESADLQASRLSALGDNLGHRFEEQDKRISTLTDNERAFMKELTEAITHRFEEQDRRIEEMQKALQELLTERMSGLSATVSSRLSEVERQFRELREQNTAAQSELRRSVESRLEALQARNTEQLEQMRATVDEKLQKTLDERISQSFQMVNERLGEVYRGLGEMQALAGDVGDLKKVMSGVKTRGIFGEIRLGAIMEEILTPEQYIENAVTRPGTANRVEFAVKLPGDGDAPVLLPIDAKFPADAYHHVVDAYESGDPERIKEATAALTARLKGCAKDIRDKYIEPPHTTTFGILFLPFEGLYAEVVRLGLVDVLQQDYRVSIAGPTTLSALLNSLQMGFRTLAIQRRSDEVWQVLGAVKTEFANFEKILAQAKKRIDQTGVELDKLIGTRTNQIRRKLRVVSELPAADASRLLDVEAVGEEEADTPAED